MRHRDCVAKAFSNVVTTPNTDRGTAVLHRNLGFFLLFFFLRNAKTFFAGTRQRAALGVARALLVTVVNEPYTRAALCYPPLLRNFPD